MRKVVLLLAILALPVSAQIPLPAAPTKFVTDAAGVIPDDRELVLNERLADFERASTHQVIVYVDRTIPEGTTLEEMSAEAIRTWAVGQEKRDNGAILFLFIDSRDSRIEVGYGLEGTLTDAMSKRILVDMRPWLRDGNYAGAIEQGTADIIRVITAEPPAAQPRAAPIAAPFDQPAPAGDSSWGESLACLFFLLLLGFFLITLIRNGAPNWPASTGSFEDPPPEPRVRWTDGWTTSSTSSSSPSPSSWGGSSSSGSSSSGSSSSGSGFSGGGGSGGGGGASDKW